MARDILYLLKADFADGPGLPYYCPDCAQVTGVLAYFPKLRYQLDVRYVDYPRPRAEIVELLGGENQGCPVLILADNPFPQAAEWISGEYQGRRFIAGAKAITNYWAFVHQVSRPH
jgi:hypothetical protein